MVVNVVSKVGGFIEYTDSNIDENIAIMQIFK